MKLLLQAAIEVAVEARKPMAVFLGTISPLQKAHLGKVATLTIIVVAEAEAAGMEAAVLTITIAIAMVAMAEAVLVTSIQHPLHQITLLAVS